MGNYVSGDIIEAVCSHPTLGDFRFSPKAAEAFTVDYGGLRNDDDESSITSQGDAIYKMNMKRWSLDGPAACDFLSDNELGGLNALAASLVEGIWTLTHISGQIWKGSGKPVGDLKADTNTGQIPLKVAGSRGLEPLN